MHTGYLPAFATNKDAHRFADHRGEGFGRTGCVVQIFVRLHLRPMIKASFWLICNLIAVLSLLPAEQLPPQALNIWDKAQHAVGFMLLTATGLAAYPRQYRPLAWGLLLFGMAIELAQSLTTWRQGDIWDWLADATGIALVMLCARVKRKQKGIFHPTSVPAPRHRAPQ